MPDESNTFDIGGGTNQIAPNATTQQQIFYGDELAKTILGCKEKSISVVVLGAGVDATLGFPTSADLIPRIVDFLETEEGRLIDATLRKAIGGVRFHFDKFVSNAIDRLAKDLDKELVTICRNIRYELDHNASLAEEHRKMGNLIVRLFRKIIDIKTGATIDAETESLIEEVFDTVVKDDTIIDFNHLNYTDTFKSLIVEILQRSMHESGNPILRHVYKNILDIEQLLSQYFYGFYTDRISYMRDYLYISWILWAYLVSEEQRIAQTTTNDSTESHSHTLYDQLRGTDSQLLTFNYTTCAYQASSKAIYFHGSLMEYVDVENKNDFMLDNLLTLNLQDFVQHRLAEELSFDSEHRAIPIPSFLPPLKLQPLLSKRYIDTWYKASQLMLRASRIIILGYSFNSIDSFFCDILRENRDAQIIIINKDLETVSHHVCNILQLPSNRYSRQIINGKELRKYNNHVTIVEADLAELNLSEYLK